MNEAICRVIRSGNKLEFKTEYVKYGNIIGRASDPNGNEVQTIIASDKKFGLLKPKNGKSYGYFITNKDDEVTNRQVRRAVAMALWRWKLGLKFEFHKAKSKQEADLVFEFRNESDDPILNSSTLAYMYYPLGGSNNGHCIINRRFYWNLSGNPVSMHFIDPVHYPDITTAPIQGLAHDLDQVLGHEIGHGVFGLQHFEGIMASHYGIMGEFATKIDFIRAGAKGVELRGTLNRKYLIIQNWILSASEREY